MSFFRDGTLFPKSFHCTFPLVIQNLEIYSSETVPINCHSFAKSTTWHFSKRVETCWPISKGDYQHLLASQKVGCQTFLFDHIPSNPCSSISERDISCCATRNIQQSLAFTAFATFTLFGIHSTQFPSFFEIIFDISFDLIFS